MSLPAGIVSIATQTKRRASADRPRSLRAVLVESLNSTRALLRQLEDGVVVSDDAQCEIVRSLFVATRDQVKALLAALECEGLE